MCNPKLVPRAQPSFPAALLAIQEFLFLKKMPQPQLIAKAPPCDGYSC
jgi:hypothetical protein